MNRDWQWWNEVGYWAAGTAGGIALALAYPVVATLLIAPLVLLFFAMLLVGRKAGR